MSSLNTHVLTDHPCRSTVSSKRLSLFRGWNSQFSQTREFMSNALICLANKPRGGPKRDKSGHFFTIPAKFPASRELPASTARRFTAGGGSAIHLAGPGNETHEASPGNIPSTSISVSGFIG
jgi:hypothetical protein